MENYGTASQLAEEVVTLLSSLGAFMEPYTERICPECREVCCIERHSRHAADDLVFLAALGSPPPPRREGIPETEPCQHLGSTGCTLPRMLRPYRCTWYFCAPLLESIGSIPREYRIFLELSERVTLARGRFLEASAASGECSGLR